MTYIETLKTLLRQQPFIDNLSLRQLSELRLTSREIKMMIDNRMIVRRDDNRQRSIIDIQCGNNRYQRILHYRILGHPVTVNPFSSIETSLVTRMTFRIENVVIIIIEENKDKRTINWRYGHRDLSSLNEWKLLEKVNKDHYKDTSIHDVNHILFEEHHAFRINSEVIFVEDTRCSIYVTHVNTTSLKYCKKNAGITEDGIITPSMYEVLSIIRSSRIQ